MNEPRHVSDLEVPGTLWAAVVRSPHPHARVVAVDKSGVEGRAGVAAVFVAADVPQVRYNTATVPPSEPTTRASDKRMLTDHPRHVGDGVAVVVADSLRNARIAAADLAIEWQPLPATTDFAASVRQEKVVGRSGFGEPGDVTGDVDVELSVDTDSAHHLTIETHCCVAEPDGDRTAVWTQCQAPSEARRIIAEVLDLPPERLRMRKLTEGGGFGLRQDLFEEPLAVWLAMRLGRPVSFRYSRDEEFVAGRRRHGSRVHTRAWFTADGRLAGSHTQAWLDSGAYASHTPHVLSGVGGHMLLCYPAGRHSYAGAAYLTHTVPAGAYRGYGMSHGAATAEQVVDEAARRIGLSPYEIRARNCAPRLRRCLDVLAARSPDPRPVPDGWLGGAGIAIGAKHSVADSGTDASTAVVELAADGILLRTGTSDSGTGSSRSLAVIAAEVLGGTADGLTVVEGDSDSVILDLGSTAQRSLFCGGQAVAAAARDARDWLLARASALWRRPVDDIEVRWPEIRAISGETVPAERLLGGGRAVFPRTVVARGVGMSYCAMRAEVVVDPATGSMRVRAVTAVVDCGTVVDEDAARGQVYGGIVQGLGLACTDSAERPGRSGVPGTILVHGAPRSTDMPRLEAVFLPTADPAARTPSGLGELPIVPAQAAIGNALRDAVGRRSTSYPADPIALWHTMHAPAGTAR